MYRFENNMYQKYRYCFVGTVHNDYGTFEIPTTWSEPRPLADHMIVLSFYLVITLYSE